MRYPCLFVFFFVLFSFSSKLFCVYPEEIENILKSDVFEVLEIKQAKNWCYALVWDSWEDRYQCFAFQPWHPRNDKWSYPDLYPTLLVRYGEKIPIEICHMLFEKQITEKQYGFMNTE